MLKEPPAAQQLSAAAVAAVVLDSNPDECLVPGSRARPFLVRAAHGGIDLLHTPVRFVEPGARVLGHTSWEDGGALAGRLREGLAGSFRFRGRF